MGGGAKCKGIALWLVPNADSPWMCPDDRAWNPGSQRLTPKQRQPCYDIQHVVARLPLLRRQPLRARFPSPAVRTHPRRVSIRVENQTAMATPPHPASVGGCWISREEPFSKASGVSKARLHARIFWRGEPRESLQQPPGTKQMERERAGERSLSMRTM